MPARATYVTQCAPYVFQCATYVGYARYATLCVTYVGTGFPKYVFRDADAWPDAVFYALTYMSMLIATKHHTSVPVRTDLYLYVSILRYQIIFRRFLYVIIVLYVYVLQKL